MQYLLYSAFLSIWLIALLPKKLLAQSILRRPNQGQAEAGFIGTTAGRTPFWLRSNQYGTIPYNSPSGTFRIGLASSYDTTRTKFDMGYGLDVVANVSTPYNFPPTQPVLLQQAYLKARFGIFEGYVGRRREFFGLADTLLTSGSYSWSGNALPVPKIQIGIPAFTPIGFTKGWVSVMGTFAHGWLGGNYVKHTFLHQKSIFFRLGKTRSTFRAYGGINHAAVWGGVSPELVKTGLVSSERLPASFRDYLLVITGFRTGSQSLIPVDPSLTDFDLTNRIGNHLGSIDVALEVDLRRHSLFIYRQNPYDTGALFYLTSISDGLNGIRLQSNNPKAFVKNVLVEFLNTTSQGGAEFVFDDPQRRGKVNYFNNAQFRDGWSYKGQSIGTPLIPPFYTSNGSIPLGVFTLNNRVEAWHLGISGTFPANFSWLRHTPDYIVKLTFSRNYGIYDAPYIIPLNQFSMLTQLAIPLQGHGRLGQSLNGIDVISRFGIDIGDLYPINAGLYLGIRSTIRGQAN